MTDDKDSLLPGSDRALSIDRGGLGKILHRRTKTLCQGKRQEGEGSRERKGGRDNMLRIICAIDCHVSIVAIRDDISLRCVLLADSFYEFSYATRGITADFPDSS